MPDRSGCHPRDAGGAGGHRAGAGGNRHRCTCGRGRGRGRQVRRGARRGHDLGPAAGRRRLLPVREHAPCRIDRPGNRARGPETSPSRAVSGSVLRRGRRLSRHREARRAAPCGRTVANRGRHSRARLQRQGGMQPRRRQWQGNARGDGRGDGRRVAGRADRAREGRAGSGETAGAGREHRDRRVRGRRVSGPRRRLRAECGGGRPRDDRGALGHRRGVLPLPRQVPVPARRRVERCPRRGRVPAGQGQGRRVLRADGGVLRLRRRARARRPCRARNRARRRHHVPGVRGGGSLLSAHHKDGFAAHSRRHGVHQRRRDVGFAPRTRPAGSGRGGRRPPPDARAGQDRDGPPVGQSLAGGPVAVRGRPAAHVHALRAADGADSREPRRRAGDGCGSRGLDAARVHAVPRLRAGDGAHLHRRRGCGGALRGEPRRGVPGSLDPFVLRARVRAAVALDVRLLRAADSRFLADAAHGNQSPAAWRDLGWSRGHGRPVGADRRPVRGGTAGRRPDLHRADG